MTAPPKSENYFDNWEKYERSILQYDCYRFQKSYNLLKKEKVGKLLGIGTSAGAELLHFVEQGWDCYGVEVSEAYKVAVQRGIKCVQSDVSKTLPFSNSYFDVVWAEEVIEHLIDTDHLLSEIKRTLKKDGILVLSTPNLASFVNVVALLAGNQPPYVQYSDEIKFGHVRYYTLGVLKRQLIQHGFKVERVIGNFLSFPDPFPNKPIRKYILSPLGTRLPRFSENFIVKARRL
jgi:SAM-dependent methyltransferase